MSERVHVLERELTMLFGGKRVKTEFSPVIRGPITGLGGAGMYRDYLGRAHPGDGQFGPGHIYLGNLRTGRIAWTPEGRRIKVEGQSDGSSSVRFVSDQEARAFTPRTGKNEGVPVVIKNSTVSQTWARGTVVRLTKEVRA